MLTWRNVNAYACRIVGKYFTVEFCSTKKSIEKLELFYYDIQVETGGSQIDSNNTKHIANFFFFLRICNLINHNYKATIVLNESVEVKKWSSFLCVSNKYEEFYVLCLKVPI